MPLISQLCKWHNVPSHPRYIQTGMIHEAGNSLHVCKWVLINILWLIEAKHLANHSCNPLTLHIHCHTWHTHTRTNRVIVQWHAAGGGSFDVLSMYKINRRRKKHSGCSTWYPTWWNSSLLRLKVYTSGHVLKYFNRWDVKTGCKWTDMLSEKHKVRRAALWSPCSHKGVGVWLAFPCLKLQYESPMNISTKWQNRLQG